jgi:hypothetical protein
MIVVSGLENKHRSVSQMIPQYRQFPIWHRTIPVAINFR